MAAVEATLTAGAPAAAAWRPRRVCVVSEANVLLARGGASAYLRAVARLLRAGGAEVHLFVAHSVPVLWRRVRAEGLEADLADFDSVRLADAWRIGGALYAARPAPWLAPLLGGGPLAERLLGVRHRAGWLPPMAPADAARARAWLRAKAPDVVIANYFNAVEVCDGAPPGAVRALLAHDAIGLSAQGPSGPPPYLRPDMAAREAEALRAVDLRLAIQEEEAAYMRTVAPAGVTAVVPHPVVVPDVALDAPRPPVALFVGTAIEANQDALDWLLDEIWPRVRARTPAARLRVVGAVGPARRGPWPDGAEAVGYVDALSAEYAGAAVALAPLRFGSGLKIKLVEALANGLPVVATPLAASGAPPAPADALTVVADADGFAAAVAAVLGDPASADRRAAARVYAERSFGVARVGLALAEALAAGRAVAAARAS